MSTEPNEPSHYGDTFSELDQGVAHSCRGPITPIAFAALSMARDGIPVFPVHVWFDEKAGKYRKKPLTKHGHKDRTADEEQVLAWWRQFPEASIAQVPADQGMVVIDRDLGCNDDPKSAEWLKDLPPTRVVRTIGGGDHWWYDTFLEFSNSKPAPRVDIRSAHGWVVAYPSPRYTLVEDRKPVALPTAYEQRLSPSRKVERREFDPIDTPANIERARTFLLNTAPAIEGQGGDDRTWRVAAEVIRNIGLSFDTTLVLMAQYYNPRCEPEWSDAELETLVSNAAKYGKGEPDWRSVSGNAIPEAYLPPDYSFGAWLAREIPKARKLAGPLNHDSKVYVLAATGVGKTMFGMGLAAHLAAGKNFCSWTIPEAKRVLYIDGEMGPRLIQDRINAVVRQLGPEVDPDWHSRAVMISNAAGERYEGLQLDTPEGRNTLLYLIEYYQVNMVVIDNVDALTAGEIATGAGIDWRGSWKATKPLRDRIQAMGVAQVWIHHAKDNGEAVGDKTRGFSMDTCILLRQPEDRADDHSVEFDLVFKKHREKDEHNRADYIGGRWKIVNGQWEFSGSLVAEIERALIGKVEPITSYELASGITGEKGTSKKHKAKRSQLERAAANSPECQKYLAPVEEGKPAMWCLPVKAADDSTEF